MNANRSYWTASIPCERARVETFRGSLKTANPRFPGFVVHSGVRRFHGTLSAWFCRCCRCSSLMSQIQQSMCSQSLSFLTCFLRKCRLKEPGVANETTLSRIGSAEFPRHKKHIIGLLSVLIDEIASLSTILVVETTTMFPNCSSVPLPPPQQL